MAHAFEEASGRPERGVWDTEEEEEEQEKERELRRFEARRATRSIQQWHIKERAPRRVRD